MKDIREIIKEAVNEANRPDRDGNGEINPKTDVQMESKKEIKKKADVKDQEKDKTPEYPEGRQDTPADYDTYMKGSQEKGDIFEKFTPIQLTALLESILRNKQRFDIMYTTLANDGFVPLNENADYDAKRKCISEMIRDGKFSKQMLQTLLETKQIQVEGPDYTGQMTMSDLERQNQEFAKYGRQTPARGRPAAAEPETETDTNPEIGDEEGALPTATAEPDTEEGGNSENVPENPEEIANAADNEILAQVADVGQAKNQEMEIQQQLKKNISELADYAKAAGFTKPDGRGDVNAFSEFLSKHPEQITPENQEWAEWFKDVMNQQIELTKNLHMLKQKTHPPVTVEPELEPVEVDEAKKTLPHSKLQLRAGAKGKIFESRLRKLEPYKKVAVLEFLENDPRMIDDQDYADMAVLTGICEADLIAMRIEYENNDEETLNEMNYPVFGGMDVRGQNQKNEAKQLDRDMKQASKSQETTEEKVHDFKIKKFSLTDTNKNVEETNKEDQNRGQHSQVGFLNAEDGTQEEKYEAQAKGFPSAANAKEHEKNPDANTAHDGGKASERDDMDTGEAILKKGEDQEEERQNEPVYPKEQVPTTGGKPKKSVNEDVDRMKKLFGYNTNAYAHPKQKENPDFMFESQLTKMRVLSESVDTSDRPTQEQLMEMNEVEYQGKKVRTDGTTYFDPADGHKLGECGAMEEARGHELEAGQKINPKQFQAGSQAKKFALQEFDIAKLDEGKETGEMCSECGRKIYEIDGVQKCSCKGAPKPSSSDPLKKTIERQNKLAGVKTEAKHLQLKHTKGNQLKAGTKAEEDVIDEAKNLQLKHSKGLQLKAGTKTEEESENK